MNVAICRPCPHGRWRSQEKGSARTAGGVSGSDPKSRCSARCSARQAAALQQPRGRCRFVNHDAGKSLYRRSNGTLRLRESEDGLEFDCDLNMNTSFGRDAYEACLRGDWKEMSFGFTVPDGGDQWDEDWDDGDRSKRIALRTVNDCDLAETSRSFPAHWRQDLAVNVPQDAAPWRSLPRGRSGLLARFPLKSEAASASLPR